MSDRAIGRLAVVVAAVLAALWGSFVLLGPAEVQATEVFDGPDGGQAIIGAWPGVTSTATVGPAEEGDDPAPAEPTEEGEEGEGSEAASPGATAATTPTLALAGPPRYRMVATVGMPVWLIAEGGEVLSVTVQAFGLYGREGDFWPVLLAAGLTSIGPGAESVTLTRQGPEALPPTGEYTSTLRVLAPNRPTLVATARIAIAGEGRAQLEIVAPDVIYLRAGGAFKVQVAARYYTATDVEGYVSALRAEDSDVLPSVIIQNQDAPRKEPLEPGERADLSFTVTPPLDAGVYTATLVVLADDAAGEVEDIRLRVLERASQPGWDVQPRRVTARLANGGKALEFRARVSVADAASVTLENSGVTLSGPDGSAIEITASVTPTSLASRQSFTVMLTPNVPLVPDVYTATLDPLGDALEPVTVTVVVPQRDQLRLVTEPAVVEFPAEGDRITANLLFSGEDPRVAPAIGLSGTSVAEAFLRGPDGTYSLPDARLESSSAATGTAPYRRARVTLGLSDTATTLTPGTYSVTLILAAAETAIQPAPVTFSLRVLPAEVSVSTYPTGTRHVNVGYTRLAPWPPWNRVLLDDWSTTALNRVLHPGSLPREAWNCLGSLLGATDKMASSELETTVPEGSATVVPIDGGPSRWTTLLSFACASRLGAARTLDEGAPITPDTFLLYVAGGRTGALRLAIPPATLMSARDIVGTASFEVQSPRAITPLAPTLPVTVAVSGIYETGIFTGATIIQSPNIAMPQPLRVTVTVTDFVLWPLLIITLGTILASWIATQLDLDKNSTYQTLLLQDRRERLRRLLEDVPEPLAGIVEERRKEVLVALDDAAQALRRADFAAVKTHRDKADTVLTELEVALGIVRLDRDIDAYTWPPARPTDTIPEGERPKHISYLKARAKAAGDALGEGPIDQARNKLTQARDEFTAFKDAVAKIEEAVQRAAGSKGLVDAMLLFDAFKYQEAAAEAVKPKEPDVEPAEVGSRVKRATGSVRVAFDRWLASPQAPHRFAVCCKTPPGARHAGEPIEFVVVARSQEDNRRLEEGRDVLKVDWVVVQGAERIREAPGGPLRWSYSFKVPGTYEVRAVIRDLEGVSIPATPMEDVRIGPSLLEVLEAAYRRNRWLATLGSTVLAGLGGLIYIQFYDQAFGSAEDYLLAFLWGAGVHTVGTSLPQTVGNVLSRIRKPFDQSGGPNPPG